MIKIIVNPSSAKGTHSWANIKERIDRAGVKYEYVMTTREKEAISLAGKIQQEGCKDIFIAGGDGTLNEVVNGLDLGSANLGVIPAGCGNDFAKMVNIRSIDDGISSMTSNSKIKVDIGVANNKNFINNLGLGIDAYVVYLKKVTKKARGEATYLLPALKALLSFSCFKVEVESEEFSYRGEALSLSVGNGACHGGMFWLTPLARIDDGLLDVCIVKKISRPKRFLHVIKAIKGTHIHLKETVIFKTRSLSVRFEKPVLAHVDGELFENPVTGMQVSIKPACLDFYLPKKDS
ncbi:MAG: diacylglycerol kinase family lipid kinase [Candidatus Omnitrophica bacterium]|nr:diacylglycerol kinase family lipid kinase [Candidatus Omnitrophota bacterium]